MSNDLPNDKNKNQNKFGKSIDIQDLKFPDEKGPELTQAGKSFRDRTNTISASGSRNWIYPKKPKGKIYDLRTYVSWILLAIFFVIPFIKIDGEPLFLFNFLERKFILFSVIFWPQDFYIFALSLLAIAIFGILFTAIYGRIWCGWACPQTIFMEMVFRKIEYAIEGDSAAQRALNAQPWNGNKIFKKGLKLGIFYALSFVVGNLLLSYIIGVDELWKIINEPISEHAGGFTTMIAFSGLFFWIFSWFREQACTFVCPYGRLQSVLLDKNTMVVAYDYKRGEPRGKFKKNRDENMGDCIDCNKCVQVCPTGIDIKNGTQLECINCAACIDACDAVMDQVGFEKGLIRWASENNIESGQKFKITGRIIAYTVLLTVLFTTVITLLTLRKDIDATILRAKGQRAIMTENNGVMNVFTMKLINKTNNEMKLSFRTPDYNSKITYAGMQSLIVPANDILHGTFLLEIPKDQLKPGVNEISIEVVDENGDVLNVKKTNFSGEEK